MSNTITPSRLMRRWYRQILGAHCNDGRPRRVATLMHTIDASHRADYVPLESLKSLVLYDQIDAHGTLSISLCGYAARVVPHGVQWGGRENSCLYKDLFLKPVFGGRGMRLDRNDTQLLLYALQMEADIQRAAKFRSLPTRRSLMLPRLWAAFRHQDTAHLQGEGPEFEEMRVRFNFDNDWLLKKFERQYRGMLFRVDKADGLTFGCRQFLAVADNGFDCHSRCSSIAG